MVIRAYVKRNTYFDSITLMKIARNLTGMQGIEDAAAIMATAPNLQLLAEAGLSPLESNAGPADVLFVVRARDESSAEAALQSAEERLSQRPTYVADTATGAPSQPRSVEETKRRQPEAQIAVISVPGPYAALETQQALRAGLHVFLFSDNVALEDEIALKRFAKERGLLLMGPDCGTALLKGAGLGFVNVVPSSSIGIVGASGTGIQQVMSLIAQGGGGISQAIGGGGRDLSEAVGAITTLQGLQLLQEDERTKVIVLISKPPAPTIAERVLQAASTGNKPVVVIFVGADHDALQQRYGDRLTITRTLAEAAQQALLLSGVKKPSAPLSSTRMSASVHGSHGYLAALFSGGTLCDEAMHIWAEQLGPIYSNIPLKPAWRLPEQEHGHVQGHCAIDFGADEYTRGRPHPMIDPGLRLKHLQSEANNLDVSVILLDIVLGYCSHPDPASVYVPAVLAAREQAASAGRALTVVISLCGTEGDPQKLSLQAAQLRAAGAEVFTSNADAAQCCINVLL
ncbi:MAG: acyl-CoA synthetase FdrA [Ktedonobacteraceae bacterium]